MTDQPRKEKIREVVWENFQQWIRNGIIFLILLLGLLLATPIALPVEMILLRRWGLKNRDRLRSKYGRYLDALNRITSERYGSPGASIKILIFSMCILASTGYLILHLTQGTIENFFIHSVVQIAITGVIGASVIGLAWVILPLDKLFSSTYVKVLVPVLISICIWLGKLSAIEILGTYFPFPPSYISNTYAIATLLCAVVSSSLVFAVLTIIFEVVMLLFLWSQDKGKKLIPHLILVAGCMAGFFGANLVTTAVFEGMSAKGRLFMLQIAEKYDFTKNHMCQANDSESVLFIENIADRAIAVRFPTVTETINRRITSDDLAFYAPQGFHTIRCNPVSQSDDHPRWCSSPDRFGFCDEVHGTK
ncbi:hypothetical protein [Herbaspirillum sp. alder98]|uniref:hypothetical protein n=1 Tax=Herbaspirillum sp. alder98 TaxID=2913096 RepID=UPI001CD910CD|nr:hypothetical protein [Herbaspirillum sp. alder98]MCA1325143.1 hypothetical protein [Herbaspirillum sp. alder98]